MIVAVLVACGGKQQQPQAFSDPDPGSDPHPGSEPDPRSAAPEAAAGEVAPPEPSDSSPGAIAAQYVDAHNGYRKQHCAPPLTWSSELAKAAQAWADSLEKQGCAFEHSRTRYGENLAGGTSGALDPAGSTEMWYREVEQYDFKKGAFSMETGHFTQVVWAGTKRIGCGQTTCKGMDIIVCNYDPPGNVQGAYRQNVKPVGCK